MMDKGDPELPGWVVVLWPIIWPLLGGLGGAIVSLGLARNEKLSARKKAFNVLAGTIIAVFLGPLIVRSTLGDARADSEMVGAVYCLVGLSATSVTERIVSKIEQWIDRLPSPRKESSE